MKKLSVRRPAEILLAVALALAVATLASAAPQDGPLLLTGVTILDGTDVAVFAANEGRRVKHMPCTTTNGLAVFVEADELPWDGAHIAASKMASTVSCDTPSGLNRRTVRRCFR